MTEALRIPAGAVPRAIQACPSIKDWLEEQIRTGQIILVEKKDGETRDL